MALKGIKVVELAGLAPVPMCGMILKDFGARVIRVEPPNPGLTNQALSRGKESLVLNLKRKDHIGVFKKLCSTSDVLLDPYRPGVLENLSLSPKTLQELNRGLIVSRVTGYGQPVTSNDATESPWSHRAGHDINYLALSGVLSTLGQHPDRPTPPVNLLADFAGGAFISAFGVVMAILERERTGLGQVLDVSMTEGAAYVASFLWGSRDHIPVLWGRPRGENILDGGAHFYRTYTTKDGGFMAVGALEPQFYERVLEGLGISPDKAPQFGGDMSALSRLFAKVFATRTRDEWCRVFDKLDACVTPVLGLDEAPLHPLHKERSAFVRETEDKKWEPAPSPRMSVGNEPMSTAPTLPKLGEDTRPILEELGYSKDEVEALMGFRSKL